MISVSDAGGIGGPLTENGENVQNAHLIMVADDGVRQGVHSKASTLVWRSAVDDRVPVNTTPQMMYFFGAERVQNNYR